MRPKSTLSLLLLALALPMAMRAEDQERRIVGYANGQPIYLSGSAAARRAAPAPAAQKQRVYVQQTYSAPRVNVGSYGTYHGPIVSKSGYSNSYYNDAYGSGYGYGGGYYVPGNGYGYGNGNGYGNRGVRSAIVPGANRVGYLSIPRYR
jgi:hypothetical protein